MGISREQALECLRSDDLIGLGMEADAVRRRLHPEGVATYALGCVVDCGSLTGAASGDSIEIKLDAACLGITDAVENGATGVRWVNSGMVVGRMSSGTPAAVEFLLRGIRRQFSSLWIEGFAAVEIEAIAASGGLSASDVIARLRDTGLDAVAGDAPALTDAAATAQWFAIHRAAHELGMRTTAGMVFGAGETDAVETLEQRVDFLDAVRALQQETGGFAAFMPMAAAAPHGRQLDSVTAVERLTMLAVARMFLDNIESMQADGVASGIDGLKVLQTALRFGANDLGMITPGSDRSEEDLRRIIRDSGLRPAQRDAAWRAMMIA